jgi:hypothetical protein
MTLTNSAPALVLSVLALYGCGSSNAKAPDPNSLMSLDASLSCEDLQNNAHDLISGVITSVTQCSTAADCKPIANPADCLDCVSIAGSDEFKAALLKQVPLIQNICTKFQESGCHLIPHGCPGFASWRCEEGKCLQQ